jgi:monothiol glutaredoxin
METQTSLETSKPSRDALAPRLDAARIAVEARRRMGDFHADVVRQVQEAVGQSAVVVVGMAQNPHVKNVRKALTEAGIAFTYLEYGSYFAKWRERLAIKLWTGWPTFPQVFVRGVLIGGEDLTKAALADGTLVRATTGEPALSKS